MKITLKQLKIPLTLWGLASLFFAFQFILRLSVGILRDDIMSIYNIDNISFASLASFYYIGYAGFQIPIGVLLDRIPVKKVLIACLLLTNISILLFAKTSNWQVLILARFLMGIGSAGAFLSIAKITNTFFPAKYHSMLLGLSFTFGLAGAVFGNTPTRYMFNILGYDFSFMLLATFGFMIALGIFLVSDKNMTNLTAKDAKSLNIKHLIELLSNKYIITMGILGGLMVGALEGFGDIWAIPFFSQTQNLSQNDSIFVASFLYIGMCVGGPLLAHLNQYFKLITSLIALTGALICFIFYLLFQYQLNMHVISILMFIMGILCCYQLLIFVLAEKIVAKSLMGATIAIINCINMSFGSFFHKIIGIVAELNTEAGCEVNYTQSLLVVPMCAAIGALGFVILGYYYYFNSNRNTREDINEYY